MEIPRHGRGHFGSLKHINRRASGSRQFLVHALLSIHPTYRATTSPTRFLPNGASTYQPAPYPPDSAIPELTGVRKIPTADELRYDELKDRRRANAVFVVLGKSHLTCNG